MLDKTGTITYGNRRASVFVPLPGQAEAEVARYAALSSLADPTPEGVSVVELATLQGITVSEEKDAVSVPFTAQTRMSGLDLADGTEIRKGAGSAVIAWLGQDATERVREDVADITGQISASGGTPLVVAVRKNGVGRVIGVIHLKDIVKDGLKRRFTELRAMGVRARS